MGQLVTRLLGEAPEQSTVGYYIFYDDDACAGAFGYSPEEAKARIVADRVAGDMATWPPSAGKPNERSAGELAKHYNELLERPIRFFQRDPDQVRLNAMEKVFYLQEIPDSIEDLLSHADDVM